MEEGDRFFEEVKAVLEAGEATWSRKQRSGWRGDWVERQRSQWDQQLRLWEAERVELLEREAEALAQSELVSEPMADVEEVPVEAQEESAVELIPVSDPFGEDGPETWIGFAFDGIGEELDGRRALDWKIGPMMWRLRMRCSGLGNGLNRRWAVQRFPK